MVETKYGVVYVSVACPTGWYAHARFNALTGEFLGAEAGEDPNQESHRYKQWRAWLEQAGLRPEDHPDWAKEYSRTMVAFHKQQLANVTKLWEAVVEYKAKGVQDA